MNTQFDSIPEYHLKKIAQNFQYPPTPDVAGEVAKRLNSGSRSQGRLRSAWVVTGLIALALTVLFAVPGVRAEIVHFFQVGVVRIFPTSPTPTVQPSIPQIPKTATPMAVAPSTATPAAGINEPFYIVTLSGLAGETSLEDAQANLSFPIRLPKYPVNLGVPNRVFLQEDGGLVLLVWADPDNPEDALLGLHEIGPGKVVFSKFEPPVIQETQVNGAYAIWTQGPYLLQVTRGVYELRRLVEGNTLIWEENGITYRLETNQTLKEAIKIAESLE